MNKAGKTLVVLVGALVWGGACSSQVTRGESESHFLDSCQQSCSGDLECVCGVCTRSCDATSACMALHEEARCLDAVSCDQAGRICDLPCQSDADCASAGEGRHCVGGSCRAGRGGQEGDAGPEADASRAPGRESGTSSPEAGACCLSGTFKSQVRYSVGFPVLDQAHVFLPCRVQRTESQSDASCDQMLPACGAAGTDVEDLIIALERSDVQQAFATAPQTYGALGFEGEGTELTYEGRTIVVGIGPCNNPGSCNPIPPGIAALMDVVNRLEEEGRLCEPAVGPTDGGGLLRDVSVTDTGTWEGGKSTGFLDWDGGPIYLEGGVYDCCFPGSIAWAREGGDAEFEQHRLTRCGSYYRRSASGAECESSLPGCEATGINPLDVANAMRHPDVRAAFESAPATYGQDRRPVDGVVDTITIDGATVVVGDPCDGAEDCQEAPEGLLKFLDLLQAVAVQTSNTNSFGAMDDCRPESACYLPRDEGPCDGSVTRYHYDSETGACAAFEYGGCGGNANNFVTKAACEESCDFDPCLRGALQDLDSGACEGFALPAANRCFATQEEQCACDCVTTGTNECGTCEG